MTAFTAADKLHRLVKQALDSGAAASIAEAEALFAGYRLALRIGDEAARDRHHQAALLTAVALARRVFLGGVSVAPLPDAPLAVPLSFGTLADAIVGLGASIGEPAAGTPVIEIGGAPSARRAPFHVRRRVRRLARRDRSGTGRSGARAGARHGAGADARRRARRE